MPKTSKPPTPFPLGFFRSCLSDLGKGLAQLREYLDTLPAPGSPDPIAQLGPGGDFVRELRPCGECGRTFSINSKSKAIRCHECAVRSLDRARFENVTLERDVTAAVGRLRVRPASEWHEDFGPVLWWRSDAVQTHADPYFGSPLHEDWNASEPPEWWSELPDFRPLLSPAELEELEELARRERRPARVECASCSGLFSVPSSSPSAPAAGSGALCSECFRRAESAGHDEPDASTGLHTAQPTPPENRAERA